MENLDLSGLRARARIVTLPPARNDAHWRPGRLRLHMAHAEPYRRLTQPPKRRAAPLWTGWMHLASLALASTGVVIGIVWVLRHTL